MLPATKTKVELITAPVAVRRRPAWPWKFDNRHFCPPLTHLTSYLHVCLCQASSKDEKTKANEWDRPSAPASSASARAPGQPTLIWAERAASSRKTIPINRSGRREMREVREGEGGRRRRKKAEEETGRRREGSSQEKEQPADERIQLIVLGEGW